MDPMAKIVETPFLIIGAGPAGASLACFLSRPPNPQTGIIISASSTTSSTPRAHITNAATLECLRDIDLEDTCVKSAFVDDYMAHVRWCHDMMGEEYGRVYAFGHDPELEGKYATMSPCHYHDIPQTTLEPILLSRATFEGWDMRFKTTLVELKEEADGSLLSLVRDELTGGEYYIRSRFVFGADGARSQVMREAKIPLSKKPSQGASFNILIQCDLNKHMEAKTGNLHWFIQPEKEYPEHSWWLLSFFPKHDAGPNEPTQEEWTRRCKEVMGVDDELPLEILSISKWRINDTIAEYYSRGNILCLGDAVHRHPPANALGSNTCVQDAYNLAWKVKLVMQDLASPALLESYSHERQPVGAGIVERANQGFRDHLAIFKHLGFLESTVEGRMDKMNAFEEATAEGAQKREELAALMRLIVRSYNGLGIEMNHRYESSAVYLNDEINAGRMPPVWPENSVVHHLPTTFPGHRLPHAWINRPTPTHAPVSTLDLAGGGSFCLFTGVGGKPWIEAASKVRDRLGLELKTVTIGWRQEWLDIYRIWDRYREVNEEGCILVRPDRFICWRSFSLVPDCEEKLLEVLAQILRGNS
ncbi:hypothetical protein G7054_g2077 [Neopestalotiopsis clavispora]|nr:hypothetical protein G7054_g2077 [Neopestalotiopsis clavispora]